LGNLNDSLEELLLALRCRAPDVFQYFMRVKKFRAIEQLDAVTYVTGRHGRNFATEAGKYS
jgi:hypothetical protein